MEHRSETLCLSGKDLQVSLEAASGRLRLSRCGCAWEWDREAAPHFFTVTGERLLFLSINPAGQLTATLSADGAAPKPVTLPSAPVPFGGSDEQGFYWGFRFQLDAALIDQLGGQLMPGSVFLGNAYKLADGETAYGAAFPAPPGAPAGDRRGLGEFVVVPY